MPKLGSKLSEETRRRMSIAKNGKKVHRRFLPDDVLFYRHVLKKKGGCWSWTARRFPNGYGQFIRPKHREVYAHRMSWIIHRSPIPTGLYVLHNCDHPECVNPDHLFLGTQRDNMRDMRSKGRATQDHSPVRKAAVAVYLANRIISRETRRKISEAQKRVRTRKRMEKLNAS